MSPAPNLVGMPKSAAYEIELGGDERAELEHRRKALSSNSFDSLDELADRLLRFGEHYRQIARPFDWTFTRADRERVLAKIIEGGPWLALAA